MGGDRPAIGSGDLAAAWGVVTALTKLEWTRVTTWLGESWAGIQILWNDLTSGLAVKMLGALATIKTAWAAAIGWMKKLWESWTSSNFMEGFTQGMLESLKAIPGMDTAFKMATGALIEDTQAQVTGVFAGRRKELPKRQAEIDAETKTRTDAIEADRKAGEDAIRQGQDQFNTARGNDVLDAQEELRLAKDRYDAALKKANEKPPEPEPSQGKKGPAAVAPEPEQVTQDKTTPVLGTFSAFEASRMGTDTVASRTANATEETARNTRLLRERREFTGVNRVFGVAINEAVPRPGLGNCPSSPSSLETCRAVSPPWRARWPAPRTESAHSFPAAWEPTVPRPTRSPRPRAPIRWQFARPSRARKQKNTSAISAGLSSAARLAP